MPRVLLSAETLFVECHFMPSVALGKICFAECRINSTPQRFRHSAKSRIPVVNIGYHLQHPISTMILLNFNTTSNIQNTYTYSLAISSQYMVLPQDMQINMKIGYGINNYRKLLLIFIWFTPC